MKKLFLTGLCLFCLSLVFAQKVLILENLSIGKSFKFFTGDDIGIRVNDTTPKVSGKITEILDSSIIIANRDAFDLKEIAVVYKQRRGIQIVSSSLMAFGTLYLGVDAVNNVIHGGHPVINADVAVISAAIVAAGGVLQLFSKRKCKISKEKWHLKIIDQVRVKSP
ncbi:MAG TPA: hypothetical protein PKW80_06600 [Bacteroidales bacterium]|mgnify:CR=1 FL=1|nr:hypothetical protein [Bacteroidales bacterium]